VWLTAAAFEIAEVAGDLHCFSGHLHWFAPSTTPEFKNQTATIQAQVRGQRESQKCSIECGVTNTQSAQLSGDSMDRYPTPHREGRGEGSHRLSGAPIP
jgi:hypothetical protein